MKSRISIVSAAIALLFGLAAFGASASSGFPAVAGPLFPCQSATVPGKGDATLPPSSVPNRPVRILAVYFQSIENEAPISVHKAIVETLSRAPGRFEVYNESIEVERFEDQYRVILADFLAKKYRDKPIDIIVAAEGISARFLETLRPAVFPTQPFIFITPQQTPADIIPGTDNRYSIADKPDFAANFRLIHDLLPSCRTLVFVSQPAAPDAKQQMEQQIIPLAKKHFPKVIDLSGLSIQQLKTELPKLPRDSAIFVCGTIHDETTGKMLLYNDMPRHITAISSVPVFACFSMLVKDGVVGGKAIQSEARGQAIADVIVQLADHAPVTRVETRQPYVFDYAALKRRGIGLHKLPAGSIVLNRPPSLYETSPGAAAAGVSTIILLLLLSSGLFALLRIRRHGENALRQSESKLRTIFNATSDAICIHDPATGAILEVNQGMTRLYGYTQEEFRALSVADLSSGEPPYSQADAIAWIRKASGGEPQSFEWQAKNRSGQLFWVDIRMSLADINGQNRVVVAVRDMTEHKQAEAALRHQEAQFRLLIEHLPQRIFFKDRHSVYISCNQPYANDLGIRPEEIAGKTDYDFHPQPLAEQYRADDRRIMEAGAIMSFDEKYRSGNEDRWIHITKIPCRGPDANIIGIFGIFEDISERKQAEEALRQSEEKYRALIETTGTGFLILDSQGKVVDANQDYVRLTGHEALVEILGRGVEEWTAPYDLERNAGGVEMCVIQGFVRDLEIDYVGHGGQIIPVEINATVVGSGGSIRILSLCRDITKRKQAEKALRESEERHRTILQMAMDGFWMVDKEGCLREVNETYSRMSGYSVQELLGMRIPDLEVAESAADVAVHIQKIMGQGEHRFESRHRRKDGGIFDVEICAQYRPAEERIVTFIRDVSERKAIATEIEQHRHHLEELVAERTKELESAKAALADSLVRYDNLVDQSHSIILEWDTSGSILFLNRWGIEFFGFSKEELLGRNVVGTIVAPVDANGEDLVRKMNEVQVAPDEFYSSENENIRKNGERVWISWTNKGILDHNGKLVKTLSIGIDRTVQRQNELALAQSREQLEETNESLRENEAQLRKIFDATPVGIGFANKKHIMQFVNPQFIEFFGANVGDSAPQLYLHQEDRDSIIEQLRRDGIVRNHEVQMFNREHQVRDMLITYLPISYGGEDGVLGWAIDITERKQAEKEILQARDAAEAANRAKSVFLANMSHELRTPLTAVLGFAEIMSRDPGIPERARENLGIIMRSGEHLLTLINDILDLSKIDAGRVEVDRRDVDLGELIRDIVNMMRGRAEVKGLRLVLDQSSEFPRFVNTDPGKIRQILVNLVGNAIKFTHAGQVSIRLATETTPDGHSLVAEVRDTGIGIGRGDLDRIFHPFEQIGNRMTEGTGLGLTITRQYVQMLGGRISVDSELGKGSCFRFTIPLGNLNAASQAPSVRHQPVGIGSPTADLRILIVEDQPENRLLLRCFLEPLGFQIRDAVNGQEAIGIFQEWRPQLIFMDRRMPVLDGLEATRRIKVLPGGAGTIIIAVSAHSFKEEQREMLAAGCNGFLAKPFGVDDLLALLKQQLHLDLIYADAEDPAPAGSSCTLAAADLQCLSREALANLHRLAVEGDDSELMKWLETQAGLAPTVKEALAGLIKDYRFDVIQEISAPLVR